MNKTETKYNVLYNTRISFIGKGILVGLVVGFVVTLFRYLIEILSKKVVSCYHYLATHLILVVPWILISIIVALLLGYLVKSDENIKGSGIPQVEGQLRGLITINWASVLWKKFVGGVLSISSGLFLGREGPSIQLGAVVAQGIGQKLKSSKSEEKILISSGASAGLAAAFNAPIAGLLFILEEVFHSFSPLVLLTSFASALTANCVSLYFFGLKPVLYLGEITSLPLKYYWALPLLGIILGILGRLYQVVLLQLPRLYGKISFLSPWQYPIIPFLLVIPIGLSFPTLLGGGHNVILSINTVNYGIWVLLGIFIMRFVFSMVSYGSNLPGGIFLPILSLGAIIGTLYGVLLCQFFDFNPIYVRTFSVFAMAGYFAAIGKAPLTAMVLVTEMVGDFSHLMAIGVVVLVSYVVVDVLNGHPIYESLLERLLQSKPSQLTGQKITIELPVYAESSFDEQMVRDIKWPKEMLLTSIRRGEVEQIPHGDSIIYTGDVLILLTDTSHRQLVEKELEKMNESL